MTADPSCELVSADFSGRRSESEGRRRGEIDATLNHWLRGRSGRFEDCAPVCEPLWADASVRQDRLRRLINALRQALVGPIKAQA